MRGTNLAKGIPRLIRVFSDKEESWRSTTSLSCPSQGGPHQLSCATGESRQLILDTEVNMIHFMFKQTEETCQERAHQE